MTVKNIFILLLLAPLVNFAQSTFTNNGATIYLQKDALIHVQGDMVNGNSDTVNGGILNDGIIELKGNFENKTGAKLQVYNNSTSTDRAIKFVGTGKQLIKGNLNTPGTASFYNLVIDKATSSDTVEMRAPLAVEGSLVFGNANTTTTYNPTETFTNNNQKGLFKTFSDSAGEVLLDIQNGSPDAIAGYPVLETNGTPSTGFILTSGKRGSSDGGIQRKITSATSYLFPVGTQDKGFNGVKLNFNEIPGNGSVKMKFCSGSSNPDGYIGSISQFCSGCTSQNPKPTNNGYNRYFPSNDCNGGAPQWLTVASTPQNFGYWSFASTNTGYSYDMEVYPNSIDMSDMGKMWRVIKHEADYGADPSLPSVNWTNEIDSLASNTKDLLTYTKNAGCYSGSGVPGGMYKDFSHFTFGVGGGGTALPVTLVYVKADPIGKHRIRVSWQTALEVNNKGFEVYRSTDGSNFTYIGWVDGHGSTTDAQSYSLDDRPSEDVNLFYYKLKQVDNNGNFVWSQIVEAKLTDDVEAANFRLYPNPTHKDIFLEVKNPADEVKVNVYDIQGQLVYNNIFTIESNGADQTLVITASTYMRNGTYIINATTNGTTFSSKFVLQ